MFYHLIGVLRPLFLGGGLCLAALSLFFSSQVWADTIWVALSGKEPVYLEVANALRRSLPDVGLRVGDWSEFNFNASAPRLLITVGGLALDELRQSAGKTRIVAVMAQRSMLDTICNASAGCLTGVYFEQPFSRQAALLRAAFPGRVRVGMVLGPTSARYRGELVRALRRVGMEPVFEVIEDKSALPEAVKSVLAQSDVFLALPDAEAINNQTAKFILLASYRRGVPVVGYSASFVKAGAALAIVSSPTQIGEEGARMAHAALSGNALPAPRAPAEFEVLVNANVSRSLNLNLDAALLTKQLRGEEGAR